ncbi:MAG: hypothetical protein E7143_01730 [Rikenellaceae bacterium]|nr:hypothetical protein [Rikenellaceae bacterium]
MRRYITLLFAALALCSCVKNEAEQGEPLVDVTPVNLAGVWELTSFDNGATLQEGDYVYISFELTDRAYTIYQNIGTMYGEKRSGHYFVDTDPMLGAVIRGNYGTDEYNFFDWSHRYKVELRASTMRWTATDDSQNVSVYTRIESLPDALR